MQTQNSISPLAHGVFMALALPFVVLAGLVAALAGPFLVLALQSTVLYLGWNYAVVAVFHAAPLAFWQAFVLLWLIRLAGLSFRRN